MAAYSSSLSTISSVSAPQSISSPKVVLRDSAVLSLFSSSRIFIGSLSLSSSFQTRPVQRAVFTLFSVRAMAEHDITNIVVAGCATGGAISAKGGPKAACAGCAGFAAFSVVIEKFLERHS